VLSVIYFHILFSLWPCWGLRCFILSPLLFLTQLLFSPLWQVRPGLCLAPRYVSEKLIYGNMGVPPTNDRPTSRQTGRPKKTKTVNLRTPTLKSSREPHEGLSTRLTGRLTDRSSIVTSLGLGESPFHWPNQSNNSVSRLQNSLFQDTLSSEPC
jgi:hypothetical protein